eukprot:NODE_784_length_699_cov_201.367692_g714_i0.p1 GENE.NODE_784_length_699_cov_201.367692_g714_i0~~NODE_784_length_699_cov_201.367692_g714_i0.p1  ORF type:complete len:137 (+),score=27.93 NODE_784_length_699_cov_201.367692_g714_i0:26-412(+)
MGKTKWADQIGSCGHQSPHGSQGQNRPQYLLKYHKVCTYTHTQMCVGIFWKLSKKYIICCACARIHTHTHTHTHTHIYLCDVDVYTYTFHACIPTVTCACTQNNCLKIGLCIARVCTHTHTCMHTNYA